MTTRNFITILMCYLSFIPIQSYAQEENTAYKVSDVPNVQVEDKNAYTTDPQQILGAEWVQKIDSLAAALRSETTVELAVVVLPCISKEYADAREFAHELFNLWGLGKKGEDNGLLVLLITEKSQREITFEVGYGLEGTLPDGLCKLIQTRAMIPLMKNGDYGAGLAAGVEEIQRVLNNSSDIKTEYDKKQDTNDFILKALKNIGIIIIILLNLIAWGIKGMDSRELAKQGGKNPYKRYLSVYKNKEKIDIYSIIVYILLSPLLLLVLPGLIFGFISQFLFKRRLKNAIICENCKAAGSSSVALTDTKLDGDFWFSTYSFKCSKCGHTHEIVEKTKIYKYKEDSSNRSNKERDKDNSSRSFSGSYRSSTSSGSWGGGSSGGGGASTKF